MQIALGKPVFGIPQRGKYQLINRQTLKYINISTVCGDRICTLNIGETCTTCPDDCCPPLSSQAIAGITVSILLVILLIAIVIIVVLGVSMSMVSAAL
jgi:hypothetical protein